MSFGLFPVEISIGGVYFPPLLFASILGSTIAWGVTRVMNRYDLVRFVWHPPLFYLALAVICTCLVGTFIIPI